MSRSPRAEALRLMQSGETISPPEMPDLEPNSPEALAYIDSFKEEHFVALAQTMDMLLGHALDNRRPDNRQNQPRRGTPKNEWQGLADLWRADLEQSRQAISSTEQYEVADRFALVTGRLNTARHISLDTKMMGGIGTGVINSFTLLRNIPNIIDNNLGPGEIAEPGDVAHHPRSLELVRRLAKLSIDQSLAAQTVLADENQPTRWADFDKALLPRHFRLHRYESGQMSLGYVDFDSLKVPAGYRPRDPFPPVTEATYIKDIPSEKKKIIGCPITLPLDENRLSQLWHWGVDLVEANGLWDEEWPAPDVESTAPELSRRS